MASGKMVARRWQQHGRGATHDDKSDDNDDDGLTAAAERRRDGVCLLLCVLAAVTVSVCFGVAVVASAGPTARAEAVLARVRAASAVDFSVAFKADDRADTPGLRRVHRALYDPAIVSVHGTLFPKVSEDTDRLRFDGWIHVETNASQRHELTLANHRGYRTVRELPSLVVVREGCLRAGDIPPLHATEAVGSTAFRAEELSAFGVNCSSGQAVEVLFMGVPFVHCVDQPALRRVDGLPTLSPADAREAATNTSSTFVFHGERVRVEAVVAAAEQPTLRAVGGDAAAHWRERAKSVPASCAYLEAPLSSGPEKRSFLYRLLPPR